MMGYLNRHTGNYQTLGKNQSRTGPCNLHLLVSHIFLVKITQFLSIVRDSDNQTKLYKFPGERIGEEVTRRNIVLEMK